jgi:glucose dehydrogenase
MFNALVIVAIGLFVAVYGADLIAPGNSAVQVAIFVVFNVGAYLVVRRRDA